MRHLCVLFALLFALACKKPNLETTIPSVEEQKMPEGIEGLGVKGVDKSGILFTNLSDPRNRPEWVQITLPSDYQYGEMITLYFKMKEGYSLKTTYNTRLDPDSVTFNYEGQYFMIHVLTPENKILRQIYLYVTPTKPLEAVRLGRPYHLTINPSSIRTQVPVKNWGTNYYLDDSLTRVMGGGVARLKNTQTGEVIQGGAGFSQLDTSYIDVVIPETIDAGEYEMTLIRDHRLVVVPDRVVISYGEPAINLNEFFNKNSFKDKGYPVSYEGYNLTPGHRYEMVLRNDLTGDKKITLKPDSHIELGTNLPLDMPSGTYQVEVYINGAPIKYLNELTGVNLVQVRENADQPAISMLSQRSQVFNGGAGKVYRPVIRFNRNEEIILYGESNPHVLKKEGQVSRLILNRVDGEGSYELPLSDSTASAVLSYFPQFKITDNLPSGRYEVRLSIQNKNETKPRISGPYYRIITIE